MLLLPEGILFESNFGGSGVMEILLHIARHGGSQHSTFPGQVDEGESL